MPYKKIISVSIALLHILTMSLPSPAFAGEFSVFQKTYIREKGEPDSVVDQFTVLNPNTVWKLRAINGNLEDDEVEKVSSSTMTLNGTEVLQPKQFSQNVNVIESEVSITSLNTVAMRLRSKPGGQLAISIFGEDNTAPTALWLAPQANESFADTNVFAQVHLTDNISGLNPQSLLILLNGANVTNSFAPFSQPTLTSTLQTHLTAAPGPNTLSVAVSDMAGLSTNASVSFSVQLLSLDPIGDQSVDLGTILTLNVAASGGSGALTFSVTPLPLPANSSFNAITGLFTFAPQPEQVGAFSLTFAVTDGTLIDSEIVTISVEEPFGSGRVTSLSGRVLDTNDFVVGTETPVVGAVISIIGTGFSTVTNASGNFVLSGLPGGSNVFDIDPSTAAGPPYAGFREEIILIEGVNNIVERPFFLPRIDPASFSITEPDGTIIVENPLLEITLEIAPNTAKNEDGTPFTGQLSISEVPDALAPASLPDEIEPGLLFTIQPVGVSFEIPALVTYPNIDNLTPGSEVDIWSLDPNEGVFMIVGVGKVSNDGSVIKTIFGGVRAADWHALIPQALAGDFASLFQSIFNQGMMCTIPSGSDTAVCTGALSEEHTIVSYRSFGQTRALTLRYDSLLADPRPIVALDTEIPLRATVPPLVSATLIVGGVEQGGTVYTNTGVLSGILDEPLHQSLQFDATGLSTGRYSYQVKLTNHYARSNVSNLISGQMMVNNRMDSPFGVGWTLFGLDRLIIEDDADVILEEGSGSTIFFNQVIVGGDQLAHWSFDDGDNPTIDDVSGRGGNLAGATFFDTDVAPVDGNEFSVNLNGSTGKMEIPDSEDFSFGQESPVSIALWVRLNGFRSIYHILGKRTGCGSIDSINYQLARDNTSQLSFASAGGIFGNLGELTVGAWTHIAFTFDGVNTLKVFVEGAEVGRDENYTLGGQNDSPLAIGTSGTCPASQFFPGDIDDIQIFDRALTDGEITTIAQGQPIGEGEQVVLGLAAPNGEYSTLNKNLDDTFTRTLKDGTRFEFDTGGLLTEVIDRNQNTTGYAYDLSGRLSTITDPANQIITLSYSGDKIATILDPAGHVTLFDHDAFGNLTKITDADLSVRFFEYDGRHHLIKQTSKNGHDTTYEYNFAGRNVKANRPDSSTREIAPQQMVGLFDPASGVGTIGNPAPVVRPTEVAATMTDGNGNVTRFETNEFGAVSTTVDALLRSTSIVRDGNNNPTQITQPNGTVTTMTYDLRGNLLTTTDQSISATTTFTYEPQFNQVTSIADPETKATVMSYDANGNVIAITDDNGTVIKMEYTDTNCPGQLTKVTSAFGLPEANATQFTYDPAKCNLSTTTDPLNHVTTLQYDMAGNVITSTDAENKTTVFEYDEMNRLTKVTDAAGGVTLYVYDEAGNLTSVTDANSNVTQFEYDSQNRLIKTTDPLEKFETFTYDGNGNLIQTIDRRLQTIDFEYDVVNQLKKKILPGVLETTFDYDTVGNLTLAVDPDSALTFTYDGASRLLSSSTTGSPNQPDVTVDYTYDHNGNRLTMTDSVNGTTTYVYDNLNRLDTITNPNSQTVDFDYDVLSRRTLTTHPNGTTTEFDYDDASQLTSLVHKLGAATLSSFGYTYDNVGNRTTNNQLRSTVSVNSPLSYTYDNLYRLINATNPIPSQTNEAFTYDALGNRQNNNASFDDANRLDFDDDFNYSYDDNGNMIQKVATVGGATTDYAYDAENQLIQINLPSGDVWNYNYDGLGRRIQKSLNAVPSTRYVYDNEDIVLEYNGSNVLQASYTHGVGIDEPLIMERGGNSFFYHIDGLESIVDLTDNLGAVVQSYVYNSFGEIVAQNGSLINPYTYTGREFDEESGLYYYRNRYYDSTIGRFINEDPIGFDGGINFYVYTRNNPLNSIDPYGKKSLLGRFWRWLNKGSNNPLVERIGKILDFPTTPGDVFEKVLGAKEANQGSDVLPEDPVPEDPVPEDPKPEDPKPENPQPEDPPEDPNDPNDPSDPLMCVPGNS